MGRRKCNSANYFLEDKTGDIVTIVAATPLLGASQAETMWHGRNTDDEIFR